MATRYNPTQLRKELYAILDQVLEAGPVEVDRNGRKVVLSASPAGPRLTRLVAHPGTVVGDKDDLASLDWSREWNSGL